jgi:hypothetical protein
MRAEKTVLIRGSQIDASRRRVLEDRPSFVYYPTALLIDFDEFGTLRTSIRKPLLNVIR